jgi:hypothetical protein
MPVLGAELMFHLGNVVVLTALVAAFVLWRYRVAILGGMGLAEGDRLPVPAGAVPAATAGDFSQTVSTALAWERRARKRVTAAYLLAVGLPALALSIFYLRQSGQPWQPAQLAAVTFITLSAAVPMVAVTLATPFWRACRNWLLLLLAGAAVTLLLAVAQRAVQGKAPTLDTFNLLWYFGLLAANQLWLPLLLLLATGNKRLRGVAPITFAGLLVFGLAPLAGSRLTQALAGTHTGSEWVLQFGINAVFVALALVLWPAGDKHRIDAKLQHPFAAGGLAGLAASELARSWLRAQTFFRCATARWHVVADVCCRHWAGADGRAPGTACVAGWLRHRLRDVCAAPGLCACPLRHGNGQATGAHIAPAACVWLHRAHRAPV